MVGKSGFQGEELLVMHAIPAIIVNFLKQRQIATGGFKALVIRAILFNKGDHQLGASHPGIVKQNVSPLLQQQVRVVEIHKNPVEFVIAVYEDKIELLILIHQFG